MIYYVAMDIGCIECGEESDCLGIFASEAAAKAVLDKAEVAQQKNWHGQHSFEVFAVEGLTETEA